MMALAINSDYRSPNYTSGRGGYRPMAIVNHITAGAAPGCMVWLCNPQSNASTHYVVTKTGQIYHLVADEDTAWGNGIVNAPSWPLLLPGVNPNLYTLSIEHEGYQDEPLTEAQYQASLQLHMLLCAEWRIPADREHIIGHFQIDAIDRLNCPGPFFPWERLLRDLQPESPALRIYIDGEIAPVYAKLEDGRTLVHIRFAELLGYDVVWDAASRIVDITKKV